ncbi:radical SAM protein [Paraburkholderia tropica]|uniref:radical SAM protein n=1 Tax=Paraburkholderia tropica TaxID=92647 RepID=UPI002AB6A10E|nr:radical SAM protein [Paraburkholderia tropica]
MSWFGGEPLAAKEIVLDVARHALECAHASGSILSGNLTTNGYFLTPTLMGELVRLNHNNFQISLDGSRELHNKTRILANGGGTFDRILRNLIQLSETNFDFTITIRLHLTETNAASLESLIYLLSSLFGNDKRFQIFFKKINQLTATLPSDLHLISKERETDIANKLSKQALLHGLRVASSGNAKMCYAARPNSLAIRASGKIQKCTVLLDSDINDVGLLESNGTISLNSAKLLEWVTGILSEDPIALACPATAIKRQRNVTFFKSIPVDIV